MNSKQQQQLQWLNDIFSKANYSPVFRQHDSVPEGMLAYISLPDVLEYRYIIRMLPIEEVSQPIFKEGIVIAQYDSAEALVSDGWELD